MVRDGMKDKDDKLERYEELFEASEPHAADEAAGFAEVGRVFRLAADESPSKGTVEELRRLARRSVAGGREPFWKTLIRLPILVPALTATIAVMVWFGHGHLAQDIMTPGKGPVMQESSDVLSREVASEARNETEESSKESQIREKAVFDDNSELDLTSGAESFRQKEQAAQKKDSKPVSKTTSDKVSDEGKDARVQQMLALEDSSDHDPTLETESLPREKLAVPKKDSKPASKRSYAEVGRERKDAEMMAEVRHGDAPEASVTHHAELDLALTQQRRGDCRASITTSTGLLSGPSTLPMPIKSRAMLSLAECYEQTGQLREAVESYEALQALDPSQAPLLARRIELLRGDPRFEATE